MFKIQGIQHFLDKNLPRWHQKENELFVVKVSEDLQPLRKRWAGGLDVRYL